MANELYATLLAFGMLVSSAEVAVGQNQTHDSLPATQVEEQLKSEQDAATQTAQFYHMMDNAALLRKLIEQSAAKREPFNSLAYRELKKRRDVDPHSLASTVRETSNADALLPLLLLRTVDQKAYEELPVVLRAEVLTDALKTSVRFNTWGLPGFYEEDASRALIEVGSAAIPALTRLLSDTRPAPVFGSQEYMIFKRYQFRVSDYALYFVEKIHGNTNLVMPPTISERDELIRSIQK